MRRNSDLFEIIFPPGRVDSPVSFRYVSNAIIMVSPEEGADSSWISR